MSKSKKDQVYDTIIDRLVKKEYRFGQNILVKELAQEIDASRQPIMAALTALSTDGFVKIIPQVGCQVIQPSKTDISDFYLMFARLEGLFAELAAIRRSARSLARLKAINLQIRHELFDGNGEDYRTLNHEFHREMHKMANSELLGARQAVNFAMSDFIIAQVTSFKPHLSEAVDEHEAIIEAIDRGDGVAARAAAEAHIFAVSASVLESMKA
ncbi:GntR family transcriptional regulator [Qipengyuania oceanensis]|uniref:FCD domain-containing protein n=1 Tax=Qipengyuania oceanensis TaxID=1463597 RepID=A0A844YKP3_9SPHN|nr:GntR family transcriptional regulator [Qipengyuania oceanensis]MXO63939.1 FCD domain-containing protein [Qipengyuania oceanensis]